MNTWKAILAALVIFGAGLVTGAVWTKISNDPKPAAPPVATANAQPNGARRSQALPLEHLRRVELMMRVQKELNLTPEQRERIEKFVGDGQERIRSLWDQVAPDIHDELQDVREKLCQELTPEQKERFDEMMKQAHKKPSSSGTNAPATSKH